MRQISVLTDVTLITCIVQRGEAEKIINAARDAGAQGPERAPEVSPISGT